MCGHNADVDKLSLVLNMFGHACTQLIHDVAMEYGYVSYMISVEIETSEKHLVVTSATLVVTGALLVVTRS